MATPLFRVFVLCAFGAGAFGEGESQADAARVARRAWARGFGSADPVRFVVLRAEGDGWLELEAGAFRSWRELGR